MFVRFRRPLRRGLLWGPAAVLLVTLALLPLMITPALAAPRPKISGFTPTSGPVGTSVTISGSGFTGATDVAFNGTSATFVINSSRQLTATAPAGATTGPISVTTPLGTATSSGVFTVLAPEPPTITAFTPISGSVGTSVTIIGAQFTGASAVQFNSKTVDEFTVVSDTQITTRVPEGATTGPISVTTPVGIAISSGSFTVTTPPPGPASVTLSVTSGPPTTQFLVSGTGYGANERVDIYFDTTDLALAATDGGGSFSGILIQVPASAAPGTHWVTAIGRTSGLAAQAPFLVRTNWAQFHFTARHTGVNPYENLLSPSNVASADLDWTYATGDIMTSSPAVANGMVYVGSYDGKLYAVDATSGALRWTYITGGRISSSPAVANGVVYVGSADGTLYAINATSGALLWTYTPGGSISSSPAVANGVVYVGGGDTLYAVNATSGALLWTYTTGGLINFSSPAVANGVVYVGSYDFKLYAINATSGALLWTYTTGDIITSSPAVANGVVYVGSYDFKFYAFDATSGALLWTYTTGGFIDSSPAVANGVVYVGGGDFKLYAFDATSGALLWTYTTGGRIGSSPAVANGVVYVGGGDDDTLYAVNATSGAPLWTYTTGSGIGSSPAVANGVVYVGSNDGTLYTFDLSAATLAAEGLAAPAKPSAKNLHPNLNLKPSTPVKSAPKPADQ